jgi:hypothetical protein
MDESDHGGLVVHGSNLMKRWSLTCVLDYYFRPELPTHDTQSLWVGGQQGGHALTLHVSTKAVIIC